MREIHSKYSWWIWLFETSLKKINPTFEAEGEINSNEGRPAFWADEVYYYPTASVAPADGWGDTDEDEATTQINQQRHTGASGTCQVQF